MARQALDAEGGLEAEGTDDEQGVGAVPPAVGGDEHVGAVLAGIVDEQVQGFATEEG